MKKTIIFLSLFLFAISLFAQEEPVVKFYLSDGSFREYNIDEVDNLSFIQGDNSSKLYVYSQNNKISFFRTQLIDSIKFNNEFKIPDSIIVFDDFGSHYFDLSDIDSMNFYIQQPTEIVENDNTKNLSDNDSITNTEISGDTVIIDYNSVPPDLNIGDIIISTDSTGFLKKIIALKKEGNKIIVETENANIKDAFKTLIIDTLFNPKIDSSIINGIEQTNSLFQKPYKGKETIYIDGKPVEANISYGIPTVKKKDEIQNNEDFDFYFSIPNFEISSQWLTYKCEMVNIGIKISNMDVTHVQLNGTIFRSSFSIDILKSFEFRNTSLSISGSQELKAPIIPPFHIPLPPVGPLVFTVGLGFDLGVGISAGLNADFNSDYTYSITSKVGYNYNFLPLPNLQPIINSKGSSVVSYFNIDNIETNIGVTYFGEAKTGIYLYAVLGPEIYIRPHVDLETVVPPCNTSAQFGSQFGGRIAIPFFDPTTLDISQDFKLLSWDLYKAPEIDRIEPDSFNIGSTVDIYGFNFGNGERQSVLLNNIEIKSPECNTWTNTHINLKIPVGTESGKLKIKDDFSAILLCGSNEIDFIIKSDDAENFETVTIGNQVWMKKNLDVDHYRNGDAIPQITDNTDWNTLTTGAWCYYENNSSNGTTYGKLYNWYAVNDTRGLAPDGWHVPSDAEWTTLTTYLGGDSIAGGKLKSTGTIEDGNGLWRSPNYRATNESGFSATPGGFRWGYDGAFYDDVVSGYWWSVTEEDSALAWFRYLQTNYAYIFRDDLDKPDGFSVRCVKNDISNSPQINSINPDSAKVGDSIIISGTGFGTNQGTSIVSFKSIKATEYTGWSDTEIKVKVPTGTTSGKISVTVNGQKSNEVDFTVKTTDLEDFESVTIGNQIWMKKNLVVDHYRNGDQIPEVKDSIQWANLTSGAWCYYDNDPAMGAIYGKLYNWHAVNDPRGLAPDGWHVPSDAEWGTLTDNLGVGAGGKLKEAGTVHWQAPNTGATNESGFSALPGGSYLSTYKGTRLGYHGEWWSSSEAIWGQAMSIKMYYDSAVVLQFYSPRGFGMSVRCVKD